ncbi:MAG: aminoglycoside phosphotransferase family protein [Deltaproteobacteria bacterium]|nr:aminoglycoside phosphotransferase family protein [Deltaproteobacteria bacterium]
MSNPREADQYPFTVQQLEAVFAPLMGDRSVRVREVFSGNINTIVRVDVDGQSYGLRVRTQEQVYRYEPDLVKEAFVAWLLTYAESVRDDREVGAAFSVICAARCGEIASSPGVLPTLRYYDWSRSRLAHPYCLYRWVEGVPLWSSPEARLYALAGQHLATIHQVTFSAFYTDFLSVGKQPVGWKSRYQGALEKEVTAARGRLPSSLIDMLGQLAIPDSVPCAPCLVHNDFSPANILVRDQEIAAVIDWDNAVIDAPHLDFVKMKYWTAKNAGGELAHHSALFAAFVEGYGTAGRGLVGSAIFTLYEVLWLLRVFNFERSKEEQDIARTPGYPAAAIYAEFLQEALGRLTLFPRQKKR